ncbi:tetratricopeptide repeat protein, partial [Streptomyces sp. NPDC094472]|uniref:tetratricopeptide repeat protein n=1 Tax=Streptomyces sp. NPDC094472 TaxID=3155080 RepID=UPI00332CF5F5
YWRGEAGDVEGAAAALTELLADMVRVLGRNHPDTLTTRNNLACKRGQTGDAEGAVAALAELLGDRVRVLGYYHPDTLVTLGNLAYWRGVWSDVSSDPTDRRRSNGQRSGKRRSVGEMGADEHE